MPSTKYDAISVTSGDTSTAYTAPSDGYIVIGYTIPDGVLTRAYIIVDGTSITTGTCTYGVENKSSNLTNKIMTCPIAKGRTAYIMCNGTINYCRFVYAVGNN